MTIRSVNAKNVSVRRVARKPLKRRSTRAKGRRAAKHSARTLITRETLTENARVIDKPTVTKVRREKHKVKDKQVDTTTPGEEGKHRSTESHQRHDEPVDDKTIVEKPSVHRVDRFVPEVISQHQSTSRTSHGLSTLVGAKKRSLVHPEPDRPAQLTSEKYPQGSSHQADSHHPTQTKKKKRKKRISPLLVLLFAGLACLLVTGIILAIVLPLLVTKNKTSATSTQTPTVLNHICNASTYTPCSTILDYELNTAYTVPPTWVWVSCCYIAPPVNESTIEFSFRADTGGWLIDDVSVTQGNGELLRNGGFEDLMSNWTLTFYPNASSATDADNVSGSQRTGSVYLLGASAGASDYVRQTFPLVPGQNALISFYWNYIDTLGGGSGVSELVVKLI